MLLVVTAVVAVAVAVAAVASVADIAAVAELSLWLVYMVPCRCAWPRSLRSLVR